MKNIRLIVDNARKEKQPYFIKKELQTILNLYAKMVSNGTWKDYSLYTGNKEISFNIYKDPASLFGQTNKVFIFDFFIAFNVSFI